MNDTIVIVIAFIACSVSVYLMYTAIKDVLYWRKKKKFYQDLLLAIKTNDIPKIKEYLNSKYLDDGEVKIKLLENIKLWEQIEAIKQNNSSLN